MKLFGLTVQISSLCLCHCKPGPVDNNNLPAVISQLTSKSGLAPNKAGVAVAEYTVPTVRMPDGSYIMESKRIARAIESLQPEPSVHLDHAVLRRVQDAWLEVLPPLVPTLVPRMPLYTLRGPSIEFHKASRARDFGMPLTELEAKYGGEKAWKAAEPGLTAWVDVLNENDRGPFCLGDRVSYADFVIVGFLEYCRCLEGDCLERVLRFDPVFGSLYDSCKSWLIRNDR